MYNIGSATTISYRKFWPSTLDRLSYPPSEQAIVIESSVSDLYKDGAYLEKHPQWHAERSPWKAEQVLRGIREVGLHPKTICDIGCGGGLALACVTKSLGGVERAVGYEPSPDVPVHPEAEGLIEFRREDITQSDEVYDVAMMLDVFEHVEDYFGFLRSCGPRAKNHVFHIPLDANVRHVLTSACMGPRKMAGHLHYFTRATALATLKDTGYTIKHWHFTKAGWEGANRKRWSLTSLSRRLTYAVSPEYTHRILGGLALLVVAEYYVEESSMIR